MAISDISLTSVSRSVLSNLKRNAAKSERTQERLATGRKVNSVLDGPTSFFAAKALRDAASDLDGLHDVIGNAACVIQATLEGLGGITALLQNMESLVNGAEMTSDQSRKKLLAHSFDQTLGQISQLVGDSSYNGTNLIANSSPDPLAASAANLNVPLGRNGAPDYVVAGNFMGSGYVLRETPGGEPAWTPDQLGANLVGYGTTSGAGVGNLSDVALVIRSSPQVDTKGDLNHDGVLQAGEGTEIDFRLTNTSGATATGVRFNNATISNGWHFLYNTSSVFGNVAPGQTVITTTSSDLDFNIPAGSDGTQFSISLDFTSDGQTRTLTFGPLTVGSIKNGQVLSGGALAAPAPPGSVTRSTDGVSIDAADYDQGIFSVTFPGPPPESKTLYAEKMGLAVYHSWAYGGFVREEGISAAKKDVAQALAMVRGYADAIGTSSQLFQIRSTFDESLSGVFRTGADDLTLADMNEESANALMLQTRQELAVTALGLGAEATRDVLRLLR